ncbi:unnamed protein product, partial [marine sediment metagenome]
KKVTKSMSLKARYKKTILKIIPTNNLFFISIIYLIIIPIDFVNL